MKRTWCKKVIDRTERESNQRLYTLREVHDLHVALTVKAVGGNITRAAVSLDVDRRSLQRKIKRIKRGRK